MAFRPSSSRWMPDPRPPEDDSWLDEEIEQEDDERMKNVMKEVKLSMRTLTNETKRKYIFEERKCIEEWKQYTNDINTTGGFEVGDYPYLSRKVYGSFITRYYYPPDTTVTDFQLKILTELAETACSHFLERRTGYSNVTVIKAMRSFSFGFWYYLTFQALLHDGDQTPTTIETKLYVEPPLRNSAVIVESVRIKGPN